MTLKYITYPIDGPDEEYRGLQKTVKEWAVISGNKENTILGRIGKNMPIDKAIFNVYKFTGDRAQPRNRSEKSFFPKVTSLCRPISEIMDYPRESFGHLGRRQ